MYPATAAAAPVAAPVTPHLLDGDDVRNPANPTPWCSTFALGGTCTDGTTTLAPCHHAVRASFSRTDARTATRATHTRVTYTTVFNIPDDDVVKEWKVTLPLPKRGAVPPPPYRDHVRYTNGEHVTHDGKMYVVVVNAVQGSAPRVSSTASSSWRCVGDADDISHGAAPPLVVTADVVRFVTHAGHHTLVKAARVEPPEVAQQMFEQAEQSTAHAASLSAVTNDTYEIQTGRLPGGRLFVSVQLVGQLALRPVGDGRPHRGALALLLPAAGPVLRDDDACQDVLRDVLAQTAPAPTVASLDATLARHLVPHAVTVTLDAGDGVQAAPPMDAATHQSYLEDAGAIHQHGTIRMPGLAPTELHRMPFLRDRHTCDVCHQPLPTAGFAAGAYRDPATDTDVCLRCARKTLCEAALSRDVTRVIEMGQHQTSYTSRDFAAPRTEILLHVQADDVASTACEKTGEDAPSTAVAQLVDVPAGATPLGPVRLADCTITVGAPTPPAEPFHLLLLADTSGSTTVRGHGDAPVYQLEQAALRAALPKLASAAVHDAARGRLQLHGSAITTALFHHDMLQTSVRTLRLFTSAAARAAATPATTDEGAYDDLVLDLDQDATAAAQQLTAQLTAQLDATFADVKHGGTDFGAPLRIVDSLMTRYPERHVSVLWATDGCTWVTSKAACATLVEDLRRDHAARFTMAALLIGPWTDIAFMQRLCGAPNVFALNARGDDQFVAQFAAFVDQIWPALMRGRAKVVMKVSGVLAISRLLRDGQPLAALPLQTGDGDGDGASAVSWAWGPSVHTMIVRNLHAGDTVEMLAIVPPAAAAAPAATIEFISEAALRRSTATTTPRTGVPPSLTCLMRTLQLDGHDGDGDGGESTGHDEDDFTVVAMPETEHADAPQLLPPSLGTAPIALDDVGTPIVFPFSSLDEMQHAADQAHAALVASLQRPDLTIDDATLVLHEHARTVDDARLHPYRSSLLPLLMRLHATREHGFLVESTGDVVTTLSELPATTPFLHAILAYCCRVVNFPLKLNHVAVMRPVAVVTLPPGMHLPRASAAQQRRVRDGMGAPLYTTATATMRRTPYQTTEDDRVHTTGSVFRSLSSSSGPTMPAYRSLAMDTCMDDDATTSSTTASARGGDASLRSMRRIPMQLKSGVSCCVPLTTVREWIRRCMPLLASHDVVRDATTQNAIAQFQTSLLAVGATAATAATTAHDTVEHSDVMHLIHFCALVCTMARSPSDTDGTLARADELLQTLFSS